MLEQVRALRSVMAIVAVIVVFGGCREDDQRTDSVTPDAVREARDALPQALVSQLDSGNVAMRSGAPEAAVEHYRRAVEIDDAVAAAWFGVYMAEGALGNDSAAAEALDRARALQPGASLLRDDAGDGPSP
ncbi:MAG: hypothetical protein U5R14_12950 [Gemmatimonadota bacterium]|nr:hypothetical protein [Gemmatimonadota bacterium]